jgi:hypothetical protein
LFHFFGTVYTYESPLDQSIKECSQREYESARKTHIGHGGFDYKIQQRFEEYPKVTKSDKDDSVSNHPNVYAWILPMILASIVLWITTPFLFFVALGVGLYYYQKRKGMESLPNTLMDLITGYKIVKKKEKKEGSTVTDEATKVIDPKLYLNQFGGISQQRSSPSGLSPFNPSDPTTNTGTFVPTNAPCVCIVIPTIPKE